MNIKPGDRFKDHNGWVVLIIDVDGTSVRWRWAEAESHFTDTLVMVQNRIDAKNWVLASHIAPVTLKEKLQARAKGVDANALAQQVAAINAAGAAAVEAARVKTLEEAHATLAENEAQHSNAIKCITTLRTMLGLKLEDVVRPEDLIARVRQLVALERRVIDERVGTELVTDTYEEP